MKKPSPVGLGMFSLALPLALTTSPISAQSPGFYFGGALGRTQLETPTAFNSDNATSPLRTLLGGYAWQQHVRAEGRLSYIKAAQTQRVAAGQFPEAPLHIRLNAFLFEANGGWSPPQLRVGRLQGVLSAGVVVANGLQGFESDTPEETKVFSHQGAVASAGLEMFLNQHFALTGRLSYRSIGERVKFVADGFGIRGASWEAGLRITP